jgi:hypothetical protein
VSRRTAGVKSIGSLQEPAQDMRSWWFGAVMLTFGVGADAQEYLSPPPSDPSPITDHMAFEAIYFLGKVSTDAQINPSSTVAGTSFNAERTFGLTDRANQFQAEILFRLEQRNRLRVSFFDLRRGGDTTVTQSVQYGSQNFTVGEEVKSEIDFRQFDLTYTYSLLRAKRYELGLGLGVQFLEAEADAEVPSTPKFDNFSGVIPFATPALDGTFLIARHWSFNARAEYLRVSVRSTSGLMEDYHGDLQYRWRSALAIGVGYEWRYIGLNLERTNPSGDVRLKVNGPEAFLRASF